MPRPLAPAGRLFAVAAFVEGFTWAGLLVGMFLKYGPVANDLGVKVFGPLHGGAFLFYVVAAALSALRLRWPWWATLLALLAAVPPLVTVPLEMWFRRIGLLGIAPDSVRRWRVEVRPAESVRQGALRSPCSARSHTTSAPSSVTVPAACTRSPAFKD